ncbi:MAG: ammonium transporter [Alphaproteobacteria bacterium]
MNAADTSWLLTSTALVLLMTLPGLALFYAGLVQSKNILSVLMQCMAIACLASVIWFVVGYSIAFAEGTSIFGGFSKALLLGISRDTVKDATTIPETLFVMFQMTFAIITPALMIGAFVERIKFSAVLLISGLWLVLVYAPVTHWVWGGGWFQSMGGFDFAGGLVVHLTAGLSSTVIVLFLGARQGFPNHVRPPHAPWMVMVGASLLWVGWYGFNAGSAVAANGDAAMAMLVTHMSAAIASLVWLGLEWTRFGKPSLVGLVTGSIAGLATITPASGYVGPAGAVVLGLAGGFICYFAVDIVKRVFKIDDSLDVLAVHGIGGVTGTILVSFLAVEALGGKGLSEGVSVGSQLMVQLAGVGATAVWSVAFTVIIVMVVRMLVGLRVSEDDETQGLDFSEHGETGYNL